MKVTSETFEGTPEEYAAYVETRAKLASPPAQPEGKEDFKEALAAFVRKALTRFPPSEKTRALLRSVYEAGDRGVFREDLADFLEVTDDQLSGVLGALGRRVHQTPGSDAIARLVSKELGEVVGYGVEILIKIERIDGRWNYRMRPEVITIMEEERLL